MSQLSFFEDNESLLFPENLLEYYPHFLDAGAGTTLLNELIDTTPWKQSTLTIKEKVILTPRLLAWYGDAKKVTIFRRSHLIRCPGHLHCWHFAIRWRILRRCTLTVCCLIITGMATTLWPGIATMKKNWVSIPTSLLLAWGRPGALISDIRKIISESIP
jgi:hypothetical protein